VRRRKGVTGNSVAEQDKAPLLELEFELEELELDAEDPSGPPSPPHPEKTLARKIKKMGLKKNRRSSMLGLHWGLSADARLSRS